MRRISTSYKRVAFFKQNIKLCHLAFVSVLAATLVVLLVVPIDKFLIRIFVNCIFVNNPNTNISKHFNRYLFLFHKHFNRCFIFFSLPPPSHCQEMDQQGPHKYTHARRRAHSTNNCNWSTNCKCRMHFLLLNVNMVVEKKTFVETFIDDKLLVFTSFLRMRASVTSNKKNTITYIVKYMYSKYITSYQWEQARIVVNYYYY